MKKATTLTDLLNGYSGTRKIGENTSEDDAMPYIERREREYLGDEDKTVESIDMSMDLSSSPSLATSQIASQEKSNASVQSFLMNSRLRKVDTQLLKDNVEAEIISLDDDFNDEQSGELLAPGSRVRTPSNFKKTALKDLFSSFKQSKGKQVKLNPSVVSSTFIDSGNKRNKRVAIVNDAPFPSQQLTEPSDDDIAHRKLEIPLSARRVRAPSMTSFTIDEYKKLNARDSLLGTCKRAKIAQRARKHDVLWSELLKPKSLNDVMLEPSLKENVSEWISQAFVKLRRTTTRNKMVKRQRPENDPLDAFIVDDDIDDGVTPREDFVPFMIMFGDGIGKNTLVEVLMESHQGQIYEVNASSNRSKKDILDSLLEFSTTHYVKGQGSKGIILLDDVDVLFKEHDKFFWQAVEKVLLTSRRPIVMLCRDLNFVPTNLVDLAVSENSLFHCKRVSHQTVTKFLEIYCRRLGVKIDQSILQLLVTCSKRDIRKCLMDLEFCCTPPGELKVPELPSQPSLGSDLIGAYNSAELLSWSDVLESGTYWKSSIMQDTDNTLMTPHAQAALGNISDEQERFQSDYMVDYRLHLIDNVNQPLLPYELNIGKFLVEKLSNSDLTKLAMRTKLEAVRYAKIKRASVNYLSTRVGKQSMMDIRPRKTRNSRRIQEIVERFDGKSSIQEPDDSIVCDFEAHNNKNIKEQICPYVLEVAKNELQVKQRNRELFLAQCEGVEQAQYSEIAWRLTHERLLKPIWFQADPKSVVESWR